MIIFEVESAPGANHNDHNDHNDHNNNNHKENCSLLMSAPSPYDQPPPPPYNPNAVPYIPKKQSQHLIKSKSVSPRSKSHEHPKPVKHLSIPKHYKSEDSLEINRIIADQQRAYNDAVNASKGYVGKPENFESYWVCARCTYGENPGTFLVCKVCTATRQLSMSLKRQHSNSDPAIIIKQSKSEYV